MYNIIIGEKGYFKVNKKEVLCENNYNWWGEGR